jgi:hypothetical protein
MLSIYFVVAAGFTLEAQTALPRQSISFSGRQWTVRQTTKPEGPGNNTFGGKDLGVLLNQDGSVTLRIYQKEGTWYAGELTTQQRTGYGEYIFRVRTAPGELDPNVVLGLFTYSGGAAYNHREIDIEFSAWGVKNAPVLGQYVIQPYQNPGHMITFDLSRIDGPASYSFIWSEGKIDFSSWMGYGPRPEGGSPELLAAWSFADPKAVPKPSPNVHMNLYLAKGEQPPSGRGATSATIDSFEFIPIKK